MACTDSVHALLDQLGDYLASRGMDPNMVNEWTRDDLPKQRPMIEMYADAYRDESNVRPPMALVLDAVVGHLNANHPKPAREVTRDDLPDFGAMGSVMAHWKVSYGAVSGVLETVVEHLNANGGLPADDRWRRAHSIVEQERDQARESLRRLRDEKDFDLFTVRDQLKQGRGERKEMTRQRDEWKSRAEAAERERDEALEGSALFQRDVHEWRTRAEAAEARTAPAITREEVEKAIHGVYAAHGNWAVTDEVADAVCALFGVEAEPADPVEAKARELAGVMHEAIKDERVEWHTAPAAVDVMAARLAAHVLGQEANDGR